MNWFVARIVYQIIAGGNTETSEFDERVILISAEDNKNAFLKASTLGKQDENSFLNYSGQKVEWKFIGVAELNKTELMDGAELHSRITDTDHAENYIHFVKQKDAAIKSGLISLLEIV